VTYKKSPGFVPVIPLVPTKLTADELKDKSAYITFTLQVSRGTGPGTPNDKKSIRTFEDGDPQQWMEVMTGLREIWLQNSVADPTDVSNTVVAIIKGDRLTAYEAAVEDLTVDPDNDTQVVPLTMSKMRCVLCLKLFFLFVCSKLRKAVDEQTHEEAVQYDSKDNDTSDE
jgi:hypothetical protein